MRYRFYKRELLKALPPLVSAQLRSCNDLPDIFELDMLDVMETAKKNEMGVGEYDVAANFKKEAQAKYPEAYKALTQMQWYIFCELMEKYPSWVGVSQIGNKFTRSKNQQQYMLVVQHIKNLRRRLKENKLPYDVVTYRGGKLGQGSYSIKML